MKTKKRLKAPFIVFSVFAFLAFLSWLVYGGLFVGLNIFMSLKGIGLTSTLAFTSPLEFLKEVFDPKFATFGSNVLHSIGSIITYVLVAVGLLFFILGVAVPKKKGGVKCVLAILSILFMAASVWSCLSLGLDLCKSLLENNAAQLQTIVNDLMGFVQGGEWKESFFGAIALLASILTVPTLITFWFWMLFAIGFGAGYAKRDRLAKKAAAEAALAEEEEIPEEIEEITEEPAEETVELAEEPAVAFVPEEEPAVAEEVESSEEPLPEPTEEPVSEEEPVLLTEPVEEETQEPVEEATVSTPTFDSNALAAMIKEVVRDIVRDEIARNNLTKQDEKPSSDSHADNHSIVGATFGGPLVVQYFNGGINGVTPTPAAPVQQVVAPAPTPIEEKPVEAAPAAKPSPFVKKEEKVVAPAAAPAVVPVPAAKPEDKDPFIRLSFEERIIAADAAMQANYNELKNEILAYGVKSRISTSGDSFRLHTKTYVKIAVAGKSLKLHFALNPSDYADSTMPVGDSSSKSAYVETPLMFKVKSPLSLRRAKQLIADAMEKDELVKGEVASVNWVKEIKASMKSNKK